MQFSVFSGLLRLLRNLHRHRNLQRPKGATRKRNTEIQAKGATRKRNAEIQAKRLNLQRPPKGATRKRNAEIQVKRNLLKTIAAIKNGNGNAIKTGRTTAAAKGKNPVRRTARLSENARRKRRRRNLKKLRRPKSQRSPKSGRYLTNELILT